MVQRCVILFAITELIDTLWNVNKDWTCLICVRWHRINRYIMECKWILSCRIPGISSRINRYIMECKCIWCNSKNFSVFELIDTLWNVNLAIPKPFLSLVGINRYIMECKCWRCRTLLIGFLELIDTLWNVNCICNNAKYHRCYRINRYIMECKFAWSDCFITASLN